MRREDALAALDAFAMWWQVETGGDGGQRVCFEMARFAWLSAWQAQAERNDALTASLRELVECEADLWETYLAADARLGAALAQARALLEAS